MSPLTIALKNFRELTGGNALAIYDHISGGDGASHSSGIGGIVGAGLVGWPTRGTAEKYSDCAIGFRRAHVNVRLNNRGSEVVVDQLNGDL